MSNVKSDTESYDFNKMITECSKTSIYTPAVMAAEQYLQSGVLLNSRSLTSVIKIFGLSNMVNDALRALRLAKERGLKLTSFNYNACINAFRKQNRYDEAISLYNEMLEEGIKPDIITYTTIIGVYRKTFQWQEALQMFNEARSLGNQHNYEPLYTAMLSALEYSNQFPLCINIFEEMQSKQITSTPMPYNIIMTTYAKQGLWQCSLDTFHNMVNDGIQPDKICLQTISDILDTANQTQLMIPINQRFFHNAPDKTSQPVVKRISRQQSSSTTTSEPRISFSDLLQQAKKSGDFRAAVAAADYWQRSQTNLTPGGVTACINIYGCAGMSERAVALIERLESTGKETGTGNEGKSTADNSDNSDHHHHQPYRVNPQQYNACMAACVRSGKYEEALLMFHNMDTRLRLSNRSETDVEVEVDGGREKGTMRDEFSYGTALNALEKLEDCETALSLFHSMKKDKIRKNILIYNTMISIVGKAGRWQLALSLFDELKNATLTPNQITYHTLVSALERGEQFEKAAELRLLHLTTSSLSLSSTSTSRPLHSPHNNDNNSTSNNNNNHNINKTNNNTTTNNTNNNTSPNISTHSKISTGTAGTTDPSAITTSGIVKEVHQAGTLEKKLLEQSSVSTIRLYGMMGQLEQAIGCLDVLREIGKPVGAMHYNAAMEACGTCGDWKRALGLYDHMVNTGVSRTITVYRTLIDIL
eukprot:gene11400-23853_t